jgi:hypothetical protein
MAPSDHGLIEGMDAAPSSPSSPSPAYAAPRVSRSLVYCTAALSVVVAYAHFAYAASHFEEWWAYGVFFVAAGNLQALFAYMLIWRPRSWLALAGVAGNLAILVVYVLSRTSGVPLGPHARLVEEAGTVDWLTAAGEVATIALLIAMLDGRPRRWAINSLMLLGALAWLLRLTGNL